MDARKGTTHMKILHAKIGRPQGRGKLSATKWDGAPRTPPDYTTPDAPGPTIITKI